MAFAPFSFFRAALVADFTLRFTDAAVDFADALTLRLTAFDFRFAAASARRTRDFKDALRVGLWLRRFAALCVTLSTVAATVPSVEPIERATSVRRLCSCSVAMNSPVFVI
jgi:hypothetical protein